MKTKVNVVGDVKEEKRGERRPDGGMDGNRKGS